MVASALSAGDDETLRQIKETSSNLLQWREPKKTASRYIDALWIALNTLATIGVVFMNKQCVPYCRHSTSEDFGSYSTSTLSDPQLRKSQIMIAAWHFSATFLVLLASTYRKWRLFKAVRLPVLKILPLSGLFAGFLILNNLSLANNSVGFYQLSKILTTPSVVLINFVLFRKYISQDKLLAVSITCVGVGLVSVESVRTNSFGTVVASAAFILTACYQIWIGKKLVDLEVDAPQLLLNQSATAVCLLIPVSYLFDEYPDFCKSQIFQAR